MVPSVHCEVAGAVRVRVLGWLQWWWVESPQGHLPALLHTTLCLAYHQPGASSLSCMPEPATARAGHGRAGRRCGLKPAPGSPSAPTSRYTCTGRVWPMRCTRAMACRSHCGFQSAWPGRRRGTGAGCRWAAQAKRQRCCTVSAHAGSLVGSPKGSAACRPSHRPSTSPAASRCLGAAGAGPAAAGPHPSRTAPRCRRSAD